MKHHLILLALIAAAVPTTSLARNTADPLCKPLRVFVASVKPDETKALEFHTSWGGGFKGESDRAIYALRCIDNGYAPA